ncbi:hypothetical protein [Priestia megaterium]|nr:hypothetical protein [Priestia megaterium]MDQ0805456.1 hypothetical protein [Priestia megaterium]
MKNIEKELKRQGKLTRSHLQTYEQFIEAYKEYRALKASVENKEKGGN